MLFLLTFLGLISVVVAISILLTSRKTLNSSEIKEIQEIRPYRSLFEPDEDEIRVIEREEKMRLKAENEQKKEDLLKEKAEKVFEFQKIWNQEPNRKNTIELIILSAQSESGELFSKTAENVLNLWKENRIENLSASDLADLLDSHFRILPQQERTSGALFWLKEEIAELKRQKSEAQTDEIEKTSDLSFK